MAVKTPKSRATTAAQVDNRPFLVLERHFRAIALALVLLATVRIAATYTVFNHTFDEPAHIACGLEWLADGVYKWEPQHPPLSRIAAGLGPYLLGTRPQRTPRVDIYSMSKEGTAILYDGHHYDLSLALARAGNLPFFWVACAVVLEWGRRYFNKTVALAALFVFTFLPPVLAHGALATTDMAPTAFLGAAFLTGLIWVAQPGIRHALWFGTATALAVLSKFSVFVYFPAVVTLALVWYLATERPKVGWLTGAVKERLPTLGLAILIALPVIWAGYRFSFGTPVGASFRMPAPEVYSGIQEVLQHNQEGHTGYLLGQISRTGFLMFYPVALAVKTPIAVLLLFGLGLVFAVRKNWPFPNTAIVACYAFGILMPAFFSRINIGVRHILPMYMAIAIVCAAAAVGLWNAARTRRWAAPMAGVLGLWLAVSSLASHPDYLAYFNEFAGSQPENILVDSDLDWGQDTKRLGQRLREVGAQEVTFGTLLIADLEGEHGFPKNHKEMDIMNPSPGWNAVSVTNWKEYRFGLVNQRPDLIVWPERYPAMERVGKSILLYHFRAIPAAQ